MGQPSHVIDDQFTAHLVMDIDECSLAVALQTYGQMDPAPEYITLWEDELLQQIEVRSLVYTLCRADHQGDRGSRYRIIIIEVNLDLDCMEFTESTA